MSGDCIPYLRRGLPLLLPKYLKEQYAKCIAASLALFLDNTAAFNISSEHTIYLGINELSGIYVSLRTWEEEHIPPSNNDCKARSCQSAYAVKLTKIFCPTTFARMVNSVSSP